VNFWDIISDSTTDLGSQRNFSRPYGGQILPGVDAQWISEVFKLSKYRTKKLRINPCLYAILVVIEI